MKKHAILSALGRDRVGVADDLAVALEKRSVAIEDSRMTVLRGQFALVAHVNGNPEDIKMLNDGLGALSAEMGFHFELERIGAKRRSGRRREFLIESFSSGPHGMSAVTGILKSHDVNIEELETKTTSAPWTNDMTFYTMARITVPPDCPFDQLRNELRELERSRELDIVIKPSPCLDTAAHH